MPRIKLYEKSDYSFSINCTVRLDDINSGWHLDNAKLVLYLNEARIRFLNELGSDGLDISGGITGILVGDLCINFLAVVSYRDELTVECEFDEIGTKGFRIFYRITNNGKVIALAEAGIICFHLKTGELLPVPPDFIERLNEYKKSGLKSPE